MNDNSSYVFNNNDFEILLNKPDVDAIVINNQEINSADLDIINQQGNIKMINFNYCNLTNDIYFKAPIEQLIVANSSVDFSLIDSENSLKELEIVNDEEDDVEVDIDDLLKFENIEILRIYNSRIINAVNINKFCNLKELFLDGSLVDVEDFPNILNKSINLTYNEIYFFD